MYIASQFNHDNKNFFLNQVPKNGMIPTLNKPTRVTSKTATTIDHILTNVFLNRTFKSGIFKGCVCYIFASLFFKS